jgi:hypothetical protein
MVKELPLTQGYVAIVDDEDYEDVSRYKWCANRHPQQPGYVRAQRCFRSNGRKTVVRLHRYILNAQPGQEVDHIDRNPLNCQRSNLRFVTRRENMVNQGMRRTNTTGFRGIQRRGNRWRANIKSQDRSRFLGSFDTPEEAALAYDLAAIEVHGPYCCLNFPERQLP